MRVDGSMRSEHVAIKSAMTGLSIFPKMDRKPAWSQGILWALAVAKAMEHAVTRSVRASSATDEATSYSVLLCLLRSTSAIGTHSAGICDFDNDVHETDSTSLAGCGILLPDNGTRKVI
jgi:hypothetical protein